MTTDDPSEAFNLRAEIARIDARRRDLHSQWQRNDGRGRPAHLMPAVVIAFGMFLGAAFFAAGMLTVLVLRI